MNLIVIIVAVYLAAMVGIGLYAKRQVKSSIDYHLAGRRLGVTMMAGTLAATEIGGGSSVGVAGKAYGDWGLSAGWYVVAAGIGIVLVSFVAPAMRRSMAVTVPEVIGRRYGAASQSITAVLGSVALVALAAVQITATATIVSTLGGVKLEWAILATGVAVIVYTWIGGMWSVTLTDFVQFFLIVGGFAIAVPVALHNAGGWESVVARLPEGQLGFTKIGMPTILGLVVLYFMTFSTGQEAVQRYYSARTPRVAVLGSLLCGGLMTFYAFIPAVLGLIALAVYPGINENSALSTVAVGLLPPVVAGLLLSAVISATLSSASGNMLGSSTIFIKDLLPKFSAKVTEENELKYSRIGVLVVGVLATLISLWSQAIIPLLIFAFTMRSTGPFCAFIAGLLMRKTSRLAGLVSIIVGTVTGFAWEIAGEPFGVAAIISGSLCGVVSFWVIHVIDAWRGRLVADGAVPAAAQQDEQTAGALS
ncbi:sodium:solute symporter family protein [Saccharopolyspora sp. NPDC002376]